ncbi:hypothetical protein D3C84_611620 [compost metagenome]
MFWKPWVAPLSWFSRVLLMFMFPQMRLFCQPAPTEMLSMLPALPMVTALPPPMLYSTSSPMTLPADSTLIGSAAMAIALLRPKASPHAQVRVFMMCSSRLGVIGSPRCRGRSGRVVCSRNRGARAPRRSRRPAPGSAGRCWGRRRSFDLAWA